MMNMTHPPADVVDALAALAEPRPMRRGSIGTRVMKCGKPTCACQTDPLARHGPYVELQRVVRGKRSARYLSEAAVESARAQVEAGRVFREQVEALWEAAEQWADAELDAIGAPPKEAPKKGGSQRRS